MSENQKDNDATVGSSSWPFSGAALFGGAAFNRAAFNRAASTLTKAFSSNKIISASDTQVLASREPLHTNLDNSNNINIPNANDTLHNDMIALDISSPPHYLAQPKPKPAAKALAERFMRLTELGEKSADYHSMCLYVKRDDVRSISADFMRRVMALKSDAKNTDSDVLAKASALIGQTASSMRKTLDRAGGAAVKGSSPGRASACLEDDLLHYAQAATATITNDEEILPLSFLIAKHPERVFECMGIKETQLYDASRLLASQLTDTCTQLAEGGHGIIGATSSHALSLTAKATFDDYAAKYRRWHRQEQERGLKESVITLHETLRSSLDYVPQDRGALFIKILKAVNTAFWTCLRQKCPRHF